MNDIKIVLEYLKSDLKDKYNNISTENQYDEFIYIKEFYIEELIENTINNLTDNELKNILLEYGKRFQRANSLEDALEKIKSFFKHSCLNYNEGFRIW